MSKLPTTQAAVVRAVPNGTTILHTYQCCNDRSCCACEARKAIEWDQATRQLRVRRLSSES